MLVKNTADHFRPRIKKHVIPEGRGPIGNRKARPRARDQAADKQQRKRGPGENDRKPVRPEARAPLIIHEDSGGAHSVLNEFAPRPRPRDSDSAATSLLLPPASCTRMDLGTPPAEPRSCRAAAGRRPPIPGCWRSRDFFRLSCPRTGSK